MSLQEDWIFLGEQYDDRRYDENFLPEMGQGVIVLLGSGAMTIAYRSNKTSRGFSQEYSWQLFGDLQVSLVISPNDYVAYWRKLPDFPKNFKPKKF